MCNADSSRVAVVWIVGCTTCEACLVSCLHHRPPAFMPRLLSRRLMGAAARNTSASASAAGSSKERPRPAIIGGQPAQKDRFPWAAQLRINDKSNLWPQFCGASLVQRQVLLTAAHVSSGSGAGSTVAV